MNKALHALVYVILAVAGVALFFEIKLFDKKELLTERNDQLIQSLIDVAGTVEEANAPKPTSQPEARKDVSPIEAKAIETPDTENVLDEYHSELETSNNKTLQWDSKRAQLRVLYQLDGEGNKIPDPGRPGSFVKTGNGTAQELLDQLFERAKAQRANLDTTRAELQNLRRKIETLVADYNKLPPIMRQDKETIVKHEGTIADLEQQKQAVEEQLKKTKAQVDDLQAEIALEREGGDRGREGRPRKGREGEGAADPASQEAGRHAERRLVWRSRHHASRRRQGQARLRQQRTHVRCRGVYGRGDAGTSRARAPEPVAAA